MYCGPFSKKEDMSHIPIDALLLQSGLSTMSGVLPQSTVSAGESEAMIALLRVLDVTVDFTTDSKVALRQLRSPHFTAKTYLSKSRILGLSK